MKTFEMPNVEVLKFSITDVIATSGEPVETTQPAGPIAPCI